MSYTLNLFVERNWKERRGAGSRKSHWIEIEKNTIYNFNLNAISYWFIEIGYILHSLYIINHHRILYYGN